MSDDKRKKAEAAIMQYINGLFGRTEGYARAVSRHFTTAVNALLDLAAKADMAPDEVFYFADDKRLSPKATAILRGLYSAVYQEIRNGVIAEWGNANAATDLMLTRLFGKGLKEDNHFARWFARNQEAMDSFFSRKDVHGGLNLSQKVWKYTSQFKEEMELALSASLGRGDSAATVSRHVRQYLQEPERLFRRVRDAKGNLKLSKRAAAYHPGRGEYRSSYRNAMRLARTETNAAYRAADCDRWGSIPFVVGMEVKRSNHPFGCEVCELLKGKYPKDFVFTGWHPQCRCYIVPVLADEKERMAYHRAVLNGEDVSDFHFKGEITEPHDGFKKWIGENQERIENAKSLPYWIKDNPKYFGRALKNAEFFEISTSESVMNNEKMEKIRIEAYDMLQKHDNERIAKLIGEYEDDVLLDESAEVRSTRLVPVERWLDTMRKADARHAARTADEIRRIQDLADLHTYGQGYVDNVHEIEKALNMKRGKRMNHEDANTGNVNPNFGKTGYGTNCSTCSAVYILRRMGFNVEALPNTIKNPLVVALSKGSTTWEKWNNGLTAYNSTLDWMNAKGYNLMNKKRYMEFIDEKTKEPGIYEFNVGYKKGGGHSTLLRRNSDGTIERIEQQVIGSWTTLDNLLNNLSGRPHKIRGIMRVDNALFNTAYSAIVKVK